MSEQKAVGVYERNGEYFVVVEGVGPERQTFGPAPSKEEACQYARDLASHLQRSGEKIITVIDRDGPDA